MMIKMIVPMLLATAVQAVAELRPILTKNFGADAITFPSGGVKSWSLPPSVLAYDGLAADDPSRTMVFSKGDISFKFGGLKPGATYVVELKYLSDSNARVQSVLIDGEELKSNVALPKKQLLVQRIPLKKSHINDQIVDVVIRKDGGLNAIVSQAVLLSDDPELMPDYRIDCFGNSEEIWGTLSDINAAGRKQFDGLRASLSLGDSSETFAVLPDGSFRVGVPQDWLKKPQQLATLKVLGEGEALTFKLADLLLQNHSKHTIASGLQDPFEIAISADSTVFFIERLGTVKMIKPGGGKVHTIAKLDVYSRLDDGLLGLAIDHNFSQNQWIYLCYSLVGESVNVVSRFTFTGESLEMDSEKQLLRIPVQRDTPPCHTGGSLAFDAEGNLFISTGDNVNPFKSNGYSPHDNVEGREHWDAQTSSADTNDLRGKILRITPQDDGSYTVPEGNLFPVGTPKTKPEIYVMGCRNPFRINVDQKTGTLYWGEVGPDARKANPGRGPAGADEINRAKVAGNYGWPHFVADNQAYVQYDFAEKKSLNISWDAQKPNNTSVANKGLSTLPAAVPAWIWYPYGKSQEFPVLGSGSRCAMGGPVFHHDPAKHSSVHLSKEYDQSVFFYDWGRSWLMNAKLDSNEELVSLERFMPDTKFFRPMDLEIGHDGHLYLLEWGSGYGGSNKNAQISVIRRANKLGSGSGSTSTKELTEEQLVQKFSKSLVAGDAKLGREFFKSPKAGCVYCHKTNEEGGMIGPSLDSIGSEMNRKELLDAIIFPSKTIPLEYQHLSIQMKDGKSYSGNPHQLTPQKVVLTTDAGKRVSLPTHEIKKRSLGPSPMPSGMGQSIDPEDMKNLIEYLTTLKR